MCLQYLERPHFGSSWLRNLLEVPEVDRNRDEGRCICWCFLNCSNVLPTRCCTSTRQGNSRGLHTQQSPLQGTRVPTQQILKNEILFTLFNISGFLKCIIVFVKEYCKKIRDFNFLFHQTSLSEHLNISYKNELT